MLKRVYTLSAFYVTTKIQHINGNAGILLEKLRLFRLCKINSVSLQKKHL
jgi:hypothetical protein